MKKLLMLLVGLVVFLPGAVKAATTTSYECEGYTGLSGPNQSYTCTIFVTTTETFNTLKADVILPANTSITITPLGDWTGSYTNGFIDLVASKDQTGTFAIFKFTFTTGAAWKLGDPCDPDFDITMNNIPVEPPVPPKDKVCEIDNGKYYCKDGSECTESEYNSQCGCRVDNGTYYCKDGNTCTESEYNTQCIPENPSTGAFTPYIIIGGCAILAIGAYIVAKNRNKFYKI